MSILAKSPDLTKIIKGKYTPFKANHIELIIMVGFPGSGKSFYTNNYIVPFGYAHVSQDLLKTAKKCMTECENNLQKGLSVVIDNTNPSKIVRKRYLDIANKYNVKCRCIQFSTSIELSKHNNNFRSMINNIKSIRKPRLKVANPIIPKNLNG